MLKKNRHLCQFLNFLLGQAKMAIYATRTEKIEQNVCNSLATVFVKLIKSRILIDYHYYRLMHDLLSFEEIWCINKILCEIVEEELLFSIF